MGLWNISSLTSSICSSWMLKVALEDFEGKSYSAVYDSFELDTESPYRLRVSGYNTSLSTLKDSLSGHNGHPFSTRDRDNDIYPGNCASLYLGAWWYTKCHSSNLNGYNYNSGTLAHNSTFYAKGITWNNGGEHDNYFSWPKVEMKIRRREIC